MIQDKYTSGSYNVYLSTQDVPFLNAGGLITGPLLDRTSGEVRKGSLLLMPDMAQDLQLDAKKSAIILNQKLLNVLLAKGVIPGYSFSNSEIITLVIIDRVHSFTIYPLFRDALLGLHATAGAQIVAKSNDGEINNTHI